MSGRPTLEIEATIIGLMTISKRAEKQADRNAALRAATLIRTLAANWHDPQPERDLQELARGIQIAHAAWLAMGAPGAWDDDTEGDAP